MEYNSMVSKEDAYGENKSKETTAKYIRVTTVQMQTEPVSPTELTSDSRIPAENWMWQAHHNQLALFIQFAPLLKKFISNWTTKKQQ